MIYIDRITGGLLYEDERIRGPATLIAKEHQVNGCVFGRLKGAPPGQDWKLGPHDQLRNCYLEGVRWDGLGVGNAQEY